jgi:hypothetical protein
VKNKIKIFITIVSFFAGNKSSILGKKIDLEKNSIHLDLDFDFLFGDLHF